MKVLKTKISCLDYISVGTLAKIYKQCGKTSCRCSQNEEYWHGPYFIWTRKEKGKTITKSLLENQAKQLKNAIKNMKKLNKCIHQWKNESIKFIENAE